MFKLFISFIFVAFFSNPAMALDCGGTEPFWNADLTETSVSFTAQGDSVKTAMSVDMVSEAAGMMDYAQTYSYKNTPVAQVLNQTCSDGMQDLDFPQTVFVYITGPEGLTTYTGCCGLGTPTK